MDFEEVQHVGMIGYDEKTETWYVQPRDSHRLMLTRQSLARLIQMYNSIHKANALVLMEERELRRLEDSRLRHSQALREAYLTLDRHERRHPLALLRRLFQGLVRRSKD
jgi:hypothetical protein